MPKGSQNQGELRGSDKNILSQNSLAQPANPWFALRGTKRLFLTISFFPPSSIKSIAGSRSFEKSSSHSLDFPGSCCSLWMGCGMWKSHLWESKADTSREGGEVGLILKSGKFGREGTLKNIPWHSPACSKPHPTSYSPYFLPFLCSAPAQWSPELVFNPQFGASWRSDLIAVNSMSFISEWWNSDYVQKLHLVLGKHWISDCLKITVCFHIPKMFFLREWLAVPGWDGVASGILAGMRWIK